MKRGVGRREERPGAGKGGAGPSGREDAFRCGPLPPQLERWRDAQLESAIPNRGSRARLLLEKAALFAGGCADPPPPLPAWASSQAGGEGEGMGGGSRPSWALAEARAVWVASHLRGDGITGSRDEGSQSESAPKLSQLRERDPLQVGRAPVPEPAGSRAFRRPRGSCMYGPLVSRVSGSFSLVAAAVRLGKGELAHTQLAGPSPSANSVSGVTWAAACQADCFSGERAKLGPRVSQVQPTHPALLRLGVQSGI